MGQRLDLQALLQALCPNVYFQPPSNAKMVYPAIVYQPGRTDTAFADNLPYKLCDQYDLTLISRDPDEQILPNIKKIPMCRHERFYVSDNLNHYVFSLYF